MKKLIPTVALALMGAAAVSGSTYAWFSMNKSVEATGMKVQATTSGALVIGTSISSINAISQNFAEADGAHILSHSTHIASTDVYTAAEAAADAEAANPRGIIEGEEWLTGLKTINDEDEVDPASGVVTDPVYHEAINPDGAGFVYYVDYEVYIASAGEAMAGKKLVMSMTDAMKQEVEKNWAYNMSAKTKGMADTLFGFTVDVYSKGVVTSANDTSTAYSYIGAYHLDDENATLDVHTGSAIPSSVNNEGTDPLAQGIHYLFRVYLDGEYARKEASFETASGTADGKTVYFNKVDNNYTAATVAQGDDVSSLYKLSSGLSSASGKYVHTEKANTTDLTIGLKFEAVNA